MELKLEGIGKRFGREWVLKGIDLRMRGGEVALVLGHNAAGKSTLLKILATVLKPTVGSYEFEGVDVLKNPEFLRGRIAYIPEDPPIIPELTVEENLEFYALLHGYRGNFHILRKRFGIMNGKRAKDLSKGMKQRLALAAAMMVEKPVMFLMDEPTNELDLETVEMIKETVRDLSSSGVIVAIASHDENLISVATRIVVLEEGEKIFDGGVEEVIGKRMVEVEIAGERKLVLERELRGMDGYRMIRILGIRESLKIGGGRDKDKV